MKFSLSVFTYSVSSVKWKSVFHAKTTNCDMNCCVSDLGARPGRLNAGPIHSIPILFYSFSPIVHTKAPSTRIRLRS